MTRDELDELVETVIARQMLPRWELVDVLRKRFADEEDRMEELEHEARYAREELKVVEAERDELLVENARLQLRIEGID